MNKCQQRSDALTGSACPKKANELFYVTHPKAAKALLGPFLSEADAECGRVVMRSASALVTARQVEAVDEFTRGHAMNNGRICREFADAIRQGGKCE